MDHHSEDHAGASHGSSHDKKPSAITIAYHRIISRNSTDAEKLEQQCFLFVLMLMFAGTSAIVSFFILGLAIWNVLPAWLLPLGLWMFYSNSNWMTISSSPPQVALLRSWGRRRPVVFSEGVHFLLKNWPFMLDLEPIEVKKAPLAPPFEYPSIECIAGNLTELLGLDEKNVELKTKAIGGTVSVTAAPTIYPAYEGPDGGYHLLQYQNAGGKEGIRTILYDAGGEWLRHVGGRLQWEDFILAKEELARQMHDYLCTIPDLGFNMPYFYITDATAVGALAQLAERIAVERRERQAEEMDIETEICLAKKYMAADPSINLQTALQMVRTNRSRNQELIVQASGNVRNAAIFTNPHPGVQH